MEKTKILKYIAEDEKGFLDKLRAFSFSSFNSQMQNLVKILLLMIEKAKQPFEVHQFLYTTIVKVLPQILSEQNELKGFVKLVKENSITSYQNTSQLIREFIIGVEDGKFNSVEYKSKEITSENLKDFKAEMIKINVFFLNKAIEQNCSHEEIMSIFYSCVEKLGAERRIIINEKALEIIRIYLSKSPQNYIQGFIRPLYSGGINNSWPEYFLHVAEPFHEQIFHDLEFPINNFFVMARDTSSDKAIIDDVENFYNALKFRKVEDGNRSLMLKNPFTPNGLELKSKSHKGVRSELKI